MTIIGPYNGFSPHFGAKLLSETKAGILLTRNLGKRISEILSEIHTYSLKNAFDNFVCEIAIILYRLQCGKKILQTLHNAKTPMLRSKNHVDADIAYMLRMDMKQFKLTKYGSQCFCSDKT